jgi:protein kinase A
MISCISNINKLKIIKYYLPLMENIKLQDLNIIKKLYQTKLSEVWLIEYNNQNYILKGKKIEEISTDDYRMLKNERKFYEENDEPNFPKFKKAFKDDKYLYLLLTFIEGIPLSSLILDKVLKFNEHSSKDEFKVKSNLFLHIADQCVDLLDKLHTKNIIHRDLKMNNIIIDKDLKVSLIDFGFSKKLDEDRTYTICGTYHIMAPEIFENKFGEKIGYTLKSDIYSLGIFIYELFFNSPPFPYVYDFGNENLISYYSNVKKGINDTVFNTNEEYATGFMNNLKNLIQGCLEINTESRISISQIKSHPI